MKNNQDRLVQIGLTYPAVVAADNPLLESRLNRLIPREAEKNLPSGRYSEMSIVNAASKYKVAVNEQQILSLRFENYFYPENFAHGITRVSAVTLNLVTGRRYRLKDLFTPGSDYQAYLDRIIQQHIAEQNIPLLESYPGINGNEVFYLTEDSLVIVYQQYELTPGYYGVLEFTIPYQELLPIIDENSPISNLLS